ncbi:MULTISPECIES: hypothetical protein [unclassified Streptomyces]|uniref:hypothetical protein n=1 Tax=unclassified Streptomyces TaxID=2593676 RepID=UPI001C610F42|nr:hypothetical protein [Streptomyces sp. CB02959]
MKQVRDYINSWNDNAKPFTWTATADEILAKVQLVRTRVKRLVNNKSKQRNEDHETPGMCP